MFFIVVLGIVIALNIYVFFKGWQVLPPFFVVKKFYSLLFVSLSLSFVLRMFYGDAFSPQFSYFLSNVGFTWFVALLYFALIAAGFDIVSLLNKIFNFYPAFIKDNILLVRQIIIIASITSVSLLFVYGSYNFNNPDITSYKIELDKPMERDSLRVVLLSDIHLSSYINGGHLTKYVQMINSQNPDLVLIAGDIADRDIAPLYHWDVASVFREIRSEYGVYAITGNHEFYGGVKDELFGYFRESGMELLIDSVAVVAGVQIVGRDDRTNSKRKELKDLIKETDGSLPIILLDHQPFGLDEAARHGVDIQLSGHTHNGQFWPGNLIVKWMYELSYGYMKKDNTHYVVSSGIGLWGPRLRIGTVSEIVVIDILPAASGSTAAKAASSEAAETASAKAASSETAGPASSTRR